MDDARLAIDAGAFDDVVVELIALFLGDERGHTQGNTSIEQCAVKSALFQTFLHRNILYRVIQKLIRRNGLRACSERTCGRTLRRYGLALSKLPLELRNDWDVFHDAASRYEKVLGTKGM